MPKKPFNLKVGAIVAYYPSAARPCGPLGTLPQVTDGPWAAKVAHVHSPRLVDLVVNDGEADHPVRFCPFLLDGDHDPQSLVGHAQAPGERRKADDTETHEIMEGKRPARGEPVEVFEARTGRKAPASANAS